MELNPLTLILIFMAIFIFLIFLLVFGQTMGGQWNQVAQGVAKFVMILVGFAAAVIVIAQLAGRKH